MSIPLPLRYPESHPPGECFFRPLNYTLSCCGKIIAPLECANGCSFVAELVERLFLTLIVALFILPSALIAGGLGVPFRSISDNFLRAHLSDPIPKTEAHVQRIPPDGNCAFVAFMTEAAKYGLELNWTIQEFREASAEWITNNWGNDQELRNRLIEAVQEYAEVKKAWMLLTQSQTDQVNHEAYAYADLNVEEPQEGMAAEYLEAISLDKDATRVYASRAHYYAWSRMFDIPFNIIIYQEREQDYNPKDEACNSLQNIIRFLHVGGNHMDLLLLNNLYN